MSRIPRTPLIVAFLGVLPFLYGAILLLGLPPQPLLADILPHWSDGAGLMLDYGRIILVFLSGALWGYATRANSRTMPVLLALSVLPALWVFWDANSLYSLFYGFLVMLGLDALFWWLGITPAWWLHLRLILTAIVCACLATGIWM